MRQSSLRYVIRMIADKQYSVEGAVHPRETHAASGTYRDTHALVQHAVFEVYAGTVAIPNDNIICPVIEKCVHRSGSLPRALQGSKFIIPAFRKPTPVCPDNAGKPFEIDRNNKFSVHYNSPIENKMCL